MPTRVVHIDIHGQRYAVRSDLDPAYISELAAYLDRGDLCRTVPDAFAPDLHPWGALTGLVGDVDPVVHRLLELGLTHVLSVVEQRRTVEEMELRVRHADKISEPAFARCSIIRLVLGVGSGPAHRASESPSDCRS